MRRASGLYRMNIRGGRHRASLCGPSCFLHSCSRFRSSSVFIALYSPATIRMVPVLPGMEREACVTLALKQDDRKDDALDRTWGPSEIVAADRLVRAREAVHGPFPEGIDTRLREVLAARGVKQLYRH